MRQIRTRKSAGVRPANGARARRTDEAGAISQMRTPRVRTPTGAVQGRGRVILNTTPSDRIFPPTRSKYQQRAFGPVTIGDVSSVSNPILGRPVPRRQWWASRAGAEP